MKEPICGQRTGAADLCAGHIVARRSKPHCGGFSLLAPRGQPKSLAAPSAVIYEMPSGITRTQRVGPSGAWNQYRKRSAGVLEYWGRRLQESARAAGGVVRSGQKCVGRWVQLGKGGQEVGKRTGFSHIETALTRLFPHFSTQVVDFPCMCNVRLFWGRHEIEKHE